MSGIHQFQRYSQKEDFVTNIGLYRDKQVNAVGKVVESVVGEILYDEAGQCSLKVNMGSFPETEKARMLSDEGGSRVIAIANESFEKLKWTLTGEYRFFVVDKFIDTNFIKDTSGGIQGCRYFDMPTWLEGEAAYSTEEAAAALNGKKWKDLMSESE